MCNFCEGDVDDREIIMQTSEMIIYIDGNGNLTVQTLDGFTDGEKLNFCPMCSRDLK